MEGEGLELRAWDEGLLAQMADWGERGFPYAGFDLGYLRDPADARRALEFALARGPHRHFVACEGEVAVGRVSVNVEDRAGLYLWAVHVPPEHEGRGVARRMVRVLCRWLQATYPGKEILLATNTFAEAAHRAYRAAGFEVTETRWQTDSSLSAVLFRMPPEEREPIARHLRFEKGRWEVRVYVMKLIHSPSRA